MTKKKIIVGVSARRTSMPMSGAQTLDKLRKLKCRVSPIDEASRMHFCSNTNYFTFAQTRTTLPTGIDHKLS